MKYTSGSSLRNLFMALVNILFVCAILLIPLYGTRIAHWSFDNQNFVDSIGGNATTTFGSPTLSTNTPSGYYYSLGLNGASYLNVTKRIASDIGSIAIWAYSTNRGSTNEQYLIEGSLWSTSYRFKLYEQRNSNVVFHIQGPTIAKVQKTAGWYQENSWRFWVASWSNGNARLTIDGVLIGEATFTYPQTNGTTFKIGQNWRGYLDEVRLYDNFLSYAEISNEMTNTFIAPVPAEPAPYTNSLVRWWNFDAGNAVDAVSNVTATGSFVSSSNTPSGSGYAFNVAAGGSLTVSKPLATNAGTLSVWALSTNSNFDVNTGFIVFSSIGANRFKLQQENKNYSFSIQNALGAQANANNWDNSYAIGTWTFWTATWDNGTMKLYVDGVLKSTKTYSYPWSNSSWNIGVNWRGLIDDVRVYNRALSESEIVVLRTNSIGGLANPVVYVPPVVIPGEPAPYSNSLIRWWNFDTGFAYDSVSNILASGTLIKTTNTPTGTGYAYSPKGSLKVTPPLSTITGTISVWALSTNTKRDDGVHVGYLVFSGIGANRFKLQQENSNYSFSIQNSAGAQANASTYDKSFSLGVWTFWTATWNNGTMKLYVDGVLKSTKTYSYPWTNAAWDIGLNWQGFIDDLRVYNRDLSASEILILRTNSIGMASPITYVPPPFIPGITGDGIASRISLMKWFPI